jgi:hypothetical protein
MKAAGEVSREAKPAAWVTPSALFPCIGRFIRFIEPSSDKLKLSFNREGTCSRRIGVHVPAICTPICFMRFDFYFSSGDPCDNRLQCADFPSSWTSYTRASNSICCRYSTWKLPRTWSYYTTLPTTTYILLGPPWIPLPHLAPRPCSRASPHPFVRGRVWTPPPACAWPSSRLGLADDVPSLRMW